jgi:hypothetical protein
VDDVNAGGCLAVLCTDHNGIGQHFEAGAELMILSRRALIAWIAAGLGGGVIIFAQDSPPPTPPPYRNPYQIIEDAASAMKPADKDSVRAVVDAAARLGVSLLMPPPMAAVVKQRVIDAQMAYLGGKTPGIVDGAVVDAINGLATAFETPDSGRVSLLMAQFFRSNMAHGMPVFLHSAPDTKLDEPNPPMSPVQALFIVSLLIDQKLGNPDYRAAPAEWDRDFYPRLLEEMRARQELQRRIAAGEVQPPKPTYTARLVGGGPNELETHVRQRIIAMSVADGLKLFNETFARLGIQ